MSSTYLRKDGRWEARVSLGSVNGKRQSRSFYGATKAQAEANMLSAFAVSSTSPITEMSVSELCYEWLNICELRVKVSTLANYRMKIEKHIIPHFGGIMCCEVTSKSAYEFMQRKLMSGLSVRYVTDIIVLLRSVFRYAYREYGIPYPFDTVIMPKCSKTEVRLLTDSEQKKLKAYISKHNDRFAPGIMLALAMGLRIGEICGLTWQDIDFEKRTLTVNKTVQRVAVREGRSKTRIMIMPPKSESSVRVIPIPADILCVLGNMESAPESFILSGTDKPVEPRKLQYHFARTLKKAKLPSVHFHSLRHSFACQALQAGFDLKTLSEILGHSRIELTMDLYIHSSLDKKRACMDLMTWSA